MSMVLQWVNAHDMIANVFLVCDLWRQSVRRPEAWVTFCYPAGSSDGKMEAPDFNKLLGRDFGRNIRRFELNLGNATYPDHVATTDERLRFRNSAVDNWVALLQQLSPSVLRIYRVKASFMESCLPFPDFNSTLQVVALCTGQSTIASLDGFVGLRDITISQAVITTPQFVLPPLVER